jgi:hypothetical protein
VCLLVLCCVEAAELGISVPWGVALRASEISDMAVMSYFECFCMLQGVAVGVDCLLAAKQMS